jgi:alpha-tubulin suppressor-like RCC1 family protein
VGLVLAALALVSVPRASGVGSSVASLGMGDRHGCALSETGGLQCWGHNLTGQVGDGTSGNSRAAPVAVSGLSSGVAQVAGGFDHTCARIAGGTVKCWGDNTYGQAGDGTEENQRETPVNVIGLTGITQIATGGFHTCALTSGGGVKCWGNNFNGQVGDGTSGNRRPNPTDVSGLTSGVAAITAGGYHTCARLTTGAVQCWGRDDSGQIGDGITAGGENVVPSNVPALGTNTASVVAGNSHTCAIDNAGSLTCWGRNSAGQLGNGGLNNALTPVQVTGLTSGVLAVSPGGFHTCALLTGGAVKCWGRNGDGQLGNGPGGGQESLPQDVTGLASGVTILSAGGDHSCVLTGGLVKCWGRNNNGQVGDGTSGEDRTTPVEALGLSSDVDGDGMPNVSDSDDDNDGCSDVRELGATVTTGGGRNPKNFWDYYDTPDAANNRDKTITVSDLVRVVGRFGTVGDRMIDPLSAPQASGYHTAFDRNFVQGSLSGPADGRVTVGDIAMVVTQFGHSCA